MEIKNIQGRDYIIDKLKVDDIFVTLMAKISEINPNMVEFRSFKPKQDENIQTVELEIMCPINEFMEDIKLMCNYLNEFGISDQTFLNSFVNLLSKHVSEIGRLIDTDLYSYIDKALILQNSIQVSFGSKFSEEQSSIFWVELLKLAINRFNDFIYLNQYDMSNPLSPKPVLLKLTDLQK